MVGNQEESLAVRQEILVAFPEREKIKFNEISKNNNKSKLTMLLVEIVLVEASLIPLVLTNPLAPN